MSLETILSELFRSILLELSFYEIVQLSVISYEMNAIIGKEINVRTPTGENWWIEKLEKDNESIWVSEVNNHLNPAELYMHLNMSFIEQVYFGTECSPALIAYLEKDFWYTIEMGGVAAIQELVKLGQMNLVWVILNSKAYSFSNIVEGYLDWKEFYIVERLLGYPEADSYDLTYIARALSKKYEKNRSPEVLRLLSIVQSHPNFDPLAELD